MVDATSSIRMVKGKRFEAIRSALCADGCLQRRSGRDARVPVSKWRPKQVLLSDRDVARCRRIEADLPCLPGLIGNARAMADSETMNIVSATLECCTY